MDDRKNHQLRPGTDQDIRWSDVRLMQLGKPRSHSLAQFGNTRDGGVMRFALFQPVDTGADNRSRRIKIRLSNFEVNDVAALPLQFIGPCKGFKCGFTLYPEHAFGNFTF